MINIFHRIIDTLCCFITRSGRGPWQPGWFYAWCNCWTSDWFSARGPYLHDLYLASLEKTEDFKETRSHSRVKKYFVLAVNQKDLFCSKNGEKLFDRACLA